MARWIGRVALLAALVAAPAVRAADGPSPMTVEIHGATGELKGTAKVYPNYIELLDAEAHPRGAIGVLFAEGQLRLFMVKADQERALVGWAQDHRLFDLKNNLVGYYNWTPIWSYFYDVKMRKVGQAQCLAYQGVCAAGIAGFLLGLY